MSSQTPDDGTIRVPRHFLPSDDADVLDETVDRDAVAAAQQDAAGAIDDDTVLVGTRRSADDPIDEKTVLVASRSALGPDVDDTVLVGRREQDRDEVADDTVLVVQRKADAAPPAGGEVSEETSISTRRGAHPDDDMHDATSIASRRRGDARPAADAPAPDGLDADASESGHSAPVEETRLAGVRRGRHAAPVADQGVTDRQAYSPDAAHLRTPMPRRAAPVIVPRAAVQQPSSARPAPDESAAAGARTRARVAVIAVAVVAVVVVAVAAVALVLLLIPGGS